METAIESLTTEGVSFLGSITRANRILHVIAGAKAVLHCEDDWVTPEKILDYYQKVLAKDFGDTTLAEIEAIIKQFSWFLRVKTEGDINQYKIVAARFSMLDELHVKALLQKKG